MPPDPARLAELAEQLRRIADELLSDTIAPHAGVLPPNWEPGDADWIRLQAEFPSLGISHELQQFTAYHRAKGSRYLSWERAFENWLAKSVKFQRRDQRSGRATATTTRAQQTTAENRRRRDETLARFDEIPDPPPSGGDKRP